MGLKRLLSIGLTASFSAASALLMALSPAAVVQAAAPPGPYFNGFETNLNGWFDLSNGHYGHIARQQSGYTNGGGYASGINSAAGRWQARLTGDPCFTGVNQDCAGPNTNWGGYTSTFPQGGYRTQIDIYLDVSWASTHPEVRFDFSSSINTNAPTTPPTFLRDFVFNAGTDPVGVTFPPPHGFFINASTNAFRGSSFPWNPCPDPPNPPPGPPCRMPVHIVTSGWYTFQHTFRNDGGQLAVDMRIFPLGSSTPVPGADWTIHPGDSMASVGGNRYGWFANEEIPDLAIDNSLRTGLCRTGGGEGDVEDKDSGKHGHAHFNGNACEGGSQGGDVEESDQNSGDNFKSDSASSSTFSQDEDSQTLTMIGSGTHNGLPVAYTMIAVDNGTLGPGLFSLVLSDGYAITGTVVNGTVAIQ